MTKLKTKTYLFDFDGTLVDSMPSYISVMLKILDDEKITYGDDIMKIITPLGYAGTAEYYRALGVKKTVPEMIATMNEYAYESYAYTIPEKSGVTEALKVLKASGASLNVLTASPHSTLDPCLKRLGLWDMFSNVWSCDDFATTKADPEIYKMAAERIGAPIEEIIFIDDNVNAVKTAKRAGMIAYGIFDESSREYTDEMKAVSDRYIENIGELIEKENDI